MQAPGHNAPLIHLFILALYILLACLLGFPPLTVFSGLQVTPEYMLHPLFLPKIWEKFIDKLHLSISRTLFCYFLAHRNILGCVHVMRRSAEERQDVIDVVQKTLHAGLIAWAKVCRDAVI